MKVLPLKSLWQSAKALLGGLGQSRTGGAGGVSGATAEPCVSVGDGGEKVVSYPDGSTHIELPDGTVMEINPDGTSYTSRPDKTCKLFDPATGETQVRYPDGTREIIKNDGAKLNVSADDIVTSVTNLEGYNVSLQPDGSVVLKSPFGGSATQVPGSYSFTGTIYTKGGHKVIYEPGGRIDVEMQDGSIYQEHEDGTTTFTGIDGTKIKHDTHTDAMEASWADGSYVKKDASATIGSLPLKFVDAVQNQFMAAQKVAANSDQLLLLKLRLGELPAGTPAKDEITLQQRPQMSHVHSLLGSKE